LIRGIGLWQATALNVMFIIGAGVFATIPAMLGLLPGPYALLAWAAVGRPPGLRHHQSGVGVATAARENAPAQK
jgi:hypothetical protein